jgi:hypothetical protein
MTILFRHDLFGRGRRLRTAGQLIRIQIEDQRSAWLQLVTPGRDLFAERIVERDLARTERIVWIKVERLGLKPFRPQAMTWAGASEINAGAQHDNAVAVRAGDAPEVSGVDV